MISKLDIRKCRPSLLRGFHSYLITNCILVQLLQNKFLHSKVVVPPNVMYYLTNFDTSSCTGCKMKPACGWSWVSPGTALFPLTIVPQIIPCGFPLFCPVFSVHSGLPLHSSLLYSTRFPLFTPVSTVHSAIKST